MNQEQATIVETSPAEISARPLRMRDSVARVTFYSYRNISTGKMREAARAGINVATTLMAREAAAIHMPSSALD